MKNKSVIGPLSKMSAGWAKTKVGRLVQNLIIHFDIVQFKIFSNSVMIYFLFDHDLLEYVLISTYRPLD